MAGPVITDFVSLWDLIEKRAAAHARPRHRQSDEDGRELTCAGYRDQAPAGRRRPARRSASAGTSTCRGSCPPGWSRSCSSARWPGSRRSRTRCCRSTATRRSGSSPSRRARSSSSRPSVWKGFDYEAMCREAAAETPGLEVLVCDKALPEGDPATLPPFTPVPDAASAPIRWIFYSSGTTADPKGARHTDPSVRASADAMTDEPRPHRRRRVRPRVPVHPHRRPDLDVLGTDVGLQARVHRGVRRRDRDPGDAGRGHHRRRRGHAVPHGLPRRAASAARGRERCSRRCGCTAAARRPSRPSSTTTSSRRWATASASAPATGSPSSRSRRWPTSPTTTRSSRYTEGRPGPDVRIKVVTLDGRVAGVGRGGRDPHQGPPDVQGLRRRVARREGVGRGRLVPHRRPRLPQRGRATSSSPGV